MIIHMISDLHGFFPEKLPGGDLLIIVGDCTSNDKIPSWNQYFTWLDQQNYRKKIMVAGNHDNFCKQWALSNDSIYEDLIERPSVTYLCDSGYEFEGIKIWGTPWSLDFKGINPQCKAFTGTENDLKEYYAKIPLDTDMLISHGPAWGILDEIQRKDFYEDGWIKFTGSYELLQAMDRVKPKLLVTGHIHENGLQTCLYKHIGPNTMCVNASYVDEHYKPRNAFMACEWDGHNFVKFDKVEIH